MAKNSGLMVRFKVLLYRGSKECKICYDGFDSLYSFSLADIVEDYENGDLEILWGNCESRTQERGTERGMEVMWFHIQK